MLSGFSEIEAKNFIKNISIEYENINEYNRYVVQIKNLISIVEPYQIKPDTSYVD